MTSLGDWAAKQLGVGDGGWRDLLGALRDRLGSGRAVSRATGVNESTIRRLISGKTRVPKASTVVALRRAVVDPGAMSDSGWSMDTRDRDSDRERTLTNTNVKLAPGTMRRMAETWIETGDQEAAAARFLEGVTVPWYRAYLKPREGDLQPVEPEEVEDPGELYYDEDGNAYEPEDELPIWYDDLAYEDAFGDQDSDYGAEVVG